MIDYFGRNIDYMRVSITDRCNLRCKYCMPHDLPSVSHEKILRYEEILRICEAASENGIKNIKITGGEPLARLGCVDFMRELKALPLIKNVTLTTNGVLLGKCLDELAEIGVDRINISLDTLNRETFQRLTGVDAFDSVYGSIMRALEMGMSVKLNCVPIAGCNDSEFLDFARLAEKYPVDIRFIEMMPIGFGKEFRPIEWEAIFAVISKEYNNLKLNPAKRGFGPAGYYSCDELKGSIGFINAVSQCFCESCNRVRLTSEGFLKPCLYHERGINLRDSIRTGADDAELKKTIYEAIYNKPEKHEFVTGVQTDEKREMSRIGG